MVGGFQKSGGGFGGKLPSIVFELFVERTEGDGRTADSPCKTVIDIIEGPEEHTLPEQLSESLGRIVVRVNMFV